LRADGPVLHGTEIDGTLKVIGQPLAFGREIAADRVERVVGARDELLHHRRERLRVPVGALELRRACAAKGLPPKAPPEPAWLRRLHEQGVAELVRGRERLGGR
jgi:hypothetical protein